MYKKFGKRLIDLVLSACGILVLSPILLILVIAIKLDSPGPVLYKAVRGGYKNKPFYIMKFRTMVVGADKSGGCTAKDDPRVTRSGRIMRRLKLDELPQLFNILAGHMAIVGPRPALWNQFDLIAERDRYGANDIRPGLTGWAQINGRDELEIDVKARYDGEYVQRMSLAFDTRCILGTVTAVLRRDGVVEGGTGAVKMKNEE